MNFFVRFQKKSRGETLLEVIVATTILAFVIVSIFSVLGQASQGNVSAKNKVIALKLAEEGVELVRQHRDTNWLRFAAKRRQNWSCESHTTCTSTSLFAAGRKYRVDTSVSPILSVNVSTEDLDLQSGTNNDPYQLYITPEGVFTHESQGNTKTKFFRQIKLEPLDVEYGAAAKAPKAKLKVQSIVEWKETSTPRKLKIEAELYDFWQRSSY